MNSPVRPPTNPELAPGARCGEREALAVARGLRWEDGRLAARTLHYGLRALGLDPVAQAYLNLFPDDGPCVVNPDALERVRSLAAAGVVVVAMGRAVASSLGGRASGDSGGIPMRGVPVACGG